MSWLESLRSWRSELAGLKRDRDKKRARIEALESAHPCKADVEAALLGEIAHFETYFDEQLVAQCLREFGADPWLKGVDGGDQPRFHLLTHQFGQTMHVDRRMLYGILAPQMRAAVKRAITNADWPKCGSPLDERKAEMDKLAANVAEIDQKIAAFNSEANAAGVRLE